MSSAFNTRTGQMHNAASRVLVVNDEVRGQLAGLRGQVEAVQAHWIGQAASTFQALMLRYDDNAHQLARALTETSEQIRTSGQTYAAQDQAAQDAVTLAGNALNV